MKVVASSLPAGLTPTYDLDGVATPSSATLSLAAGASRTDVDFGYKHTGSVGDRVWLDTNGNGVQDAGEAGINGVTVQLLNAGGTVVATTTTSGDGNYTFNNLAAGNYTVKIVASSLPAGTAPTFDLDGIASANQAGFTLAAGASRTDVDFGYKYTGSIGDRVWLDTNANGAQDAGEAGINGVTVQLLDGGGNVLATATTSGDGNYTFNNLAGGSYTVRIVASSLPAGVAPSFDLDGIATANQASFTLAAGANRTDVDFGYKQTGSVGDRVWLDANGDGNQDAGEAGINGVTVQLLNAANTVVATATTSGDGNYTFNNLAAGNYTVKIVASSLPAGTAPTFDLDGIATANQAGFTLAAGQNRTDVDFGYKYTGSVGDRVWLDANANGVQDAGEAGINGVTVQLLNAGGTVIATTSTSGNGNYTFANLAGGNYTVKIVASSLPAGTAPTFDLDGIATANQASFTLAAGASRTDVDFGYKNTGSVGDRVWLDTNGNGNQDAGETGINGVTVQLAQLGRHGDRHHDHGGRRQLHLRQPGPGHVHRQGGLHHAAGRPRRPPSTSTASRRLTRATFTLTAGQNRTDVDFGYRGTLSVGDRVWNDANGNGVQDAGETGINGVTVQLLSGSTVIATTTTSGNGNYTFANLVAGTYTVKVVIRPAGTTQTYDLDGISTANQATVSLTASRTDVDFGYRTIGTLSIGDRVWKDANANGLQDSGEAGISGVTVQLLSGSTVVATTTTNSSGNYTFSSLVAGTYIVKIVTSTLPANFTQTYDLDGLSSAHQATVNLTASRTDVDFGYHFYSSSAPRNGDPRVLEEPLGGLAGAVDHHRRGHLHESPRPSPGWAPR